MTAQEDIFRRAASGEITNEQAGAELARLYEAGVNVSAHDVAAGEAAATSGVPAPPAVAPTDYDPASGVDPTPAQYAALSGRQLVFLERAMPGVGDRVKSSEEWRALAVEEATRETEIARVAAYDARFESDETFRNAELARMARERLDAEWWHLPMTARLALAADAGLTTQQYSELSADKDRLADDRRPATVTGGAA